MSLHLCHLPPPPPRHRRPPPFHRSLSTCPPPPQPLRGVSLASKPTASDLRAVDWSPDGAALAALSAKEQTLALKSQREWRSALLLLRCLRSLDGYSPNAIHYNVVLRTLGRARRWDELRRLWADMARDGVLPTNPTYATLIDAFDRAGLPPADSLLWLRHMRARALAPDEVTAATVLRVLKDAGRFDHAHAFFAQWRAGHLDFDLAGLADPAAASDPSTPTHFLLTELFRSGGRPPVPATAAAREGPRKPRLAATYNTLIDMYGKAGRLDDASEAFAEMLQSGVAPDTFTFNTMINVCGSHGQLSEAEALLGKMEERRIRPDTKTFNIFMSIHASAGDVEKVIMYFRKIGETGLRPDTVTYRIILQVLCERKMDQEVEDVIDGMLQSGACVDEQSMPVVMKMYIDEGLLEEANIFFEKHCSSGEVSSKIYAAIMDAYADKGFWKEAENVFFVKRDIRQRKDVMEYNVMIKVYGKAKMYDKALSLFESMKNCGNWPDECTYNSLIQMLSAGDLLDRARELLGKMKEAGFRPRCETFSAVIASHCRKGLVSEAVKIFNGMKVIGVEPNEVIFGLLIDGFAESGKVEEALHYYHLMEELGLVANQIVLTSLIKAYSKVNCWKEAQELYASMKNLDGGPDVIASNCMINLYAGLGMVSEAKLIFDQLRRNGQADGVSHTTMMYLYKSMGMLNEASDVAQEMHQSGLLTDCASYNNILASYAVSGKLKDCGELLHQMCSKKMLPDASTFKTLFIILKKGGLSPEAVLQLELAHDAGKAYARQAILTSVFSVVGLHSFALESCSAFLRAGVALDSSAYNVAIHTYGASGDIERALKLFMKMQDGGLKPDLVTYINLAGCYGKAGMLEGLRRIYSLLKHGETDYSGSLFKALRDAYKVAGRNDLAEMVEQEMRFSINVEEDDDLETEDDTLVSPA